MQQIELQIGHMQMLYLVSGSNPIMRDVRERDEQKNELTIHQ